MDSPEHTIEVTAVSADVSASTDSPSVQNSPFFSFLSNLSPIEVVKAAHVPQSCLGFNSPPPLFSSPHLNPQHGTRVLKRLQNHQSPSEEISHNDGGRNINPVQKYLGKSFLQSLTVSITGPEKDKQNEESIQAQLCSSACVDEYLSDLPEVDCTNSESALKSGPSQLNDVSLSSPSSSVKMKETLSKSFSNNDAVKEISTEVDRSMTEQSIQQNSQGKPTHDIEAANLEEVRRDDQLMPGNCLDIICDLSADHAGQKQKCQYLGALLQNGRRCLQDEHHSGSQLPELWQNVQAYEDCSENMEVISGAHVEDTIVHDLEGTTMTILHPEYCSHKASQYRGMSRRCLQFEEAQPSTMANSTCPARLTDFVSDSGLPATIAESGNLDPFHVDISATPRKSEDPNFPQITKGPPTGSGNNCLNTSRPSGIGLHLNSIVNAVPRGSGASADLKLAKGHVGPQSSKLASTTDHSLEGRKRKGSHGTSAAASECCNTLGTLNTSNSAEHVATPHDEMKLVSEHADITEDPNQQGPNKKRKKTLNTNNTDGCKRCNCKKTKCLKLYCDCFAAGIYCAGPCACQGCFNRPEYEETVVKTRKQIESRNPIAFAPRVIANTREDGSGTTPSSARHKRGCNCKKSMCLKKYCECFQANVGCSEGCRCEGCKNVYGRKKGYGAIKEMNNQVYVEKLNGKFGKKLEAVATKKDVSQAELSEPCRTPTASFQSSKIQRDSDGNDTILTSNKENLDGGCCDGTADYNRSEIMERISPRYDMRAETYHVMPLSNSSVCISPSASPRTSETANISLTQLCPGGNGHASGNSKDWHNSPATPIVLLGGTESHQRLESDSGLYDVLDDETPEILKDTSELNNSVKVSSPNKKRVSPPHRHVHELGTGSSGPLRSGRKFILKSVPSFPPLTPCIDSRSSSCQNRSDIPVSDKTGNI